MISEENINKLYEIILDGKELTTCELNSCGFKSNDLVKLINEGVLVRVRRGLYKLENVDSLFYYGKYLLSKKEYGKANLCFEKCFMLDPTHLGACFQLFLRSIQNKNYEKAFQYFEILSKSENEFYNIDYNYYLYLLSIITEVPENYIEYVKYLKYDDIKIPTNDKRYENIQLQNKIRFTVMQGKYSYALRQLNELVDKHGKITVQDFIARILLSQALEIEEKSRKVLFSLIKEKKYEEVANHLLDKQYRHRLTNLEENILQLSLQYVDIQESSIIPSLDNFEARNLDEAIMAHDYKLALKFNTEYMEKHHISSDSNFLNYVLNDICNLIDSLSLEDKTTLKIEEKSDIIIKEKVSEITLDTIISYLMKNDIDNAFDSLRSYLNSIGKSEYEFLIIDLIKINVLEQDIYYKKPISLITLISKDRYNFDFSEFVMGFYTSLTQNKFEISRLYLDIISNAHKLGQESVITNGLLEVLETTEKAFGYKREKALSENMDIDPELIDDIFYSESDKEETPDTLLNVEEEIDGDREFISECYKKLSSLKGIILLDPMDEVRKDKILSIASEYQDMVAFVIENEGQEQIVLRYKKVSSERLDIKGIIGLSSKAYKDGDYDKCIEYSLFLLQVFEEPKSFNYSKLGFAYYKKGNLKLAIDYLTVANALAKKEGLNYDYRDMILNLKKSISNEKNNNDSEEELIRSKYKELVLNKGVILLRDVEENKIEKLLNIVRSYKDIKVFVIEEEKKKHIVLRYFPYSEKLGNENVRKILDNFDQSYKDGDYDKVLEYGLFLLQLFKEPEQNYYFIIGMAYAKKGNLKLAIDYLTVANALAKVNNSKYDYTDLILKLQGNYKEACKSKIKMLETDFEDLNDYYGIENFDEINDYIVSSGLDVESACLQLSMTIEQINIVRLIYAREFYIQGNFAKGDLFFKTVERSKNKTKKIMKILEEIRKNRNFYQNREVEEHRELVLTLNPGKGS